ncbi:hypothetical protein GMRT_23779 [Giardia muris]|uniref:Uncharacterized protein n=1 Tax=Giardia muris TaxID=5742 RepID=A0A4Z1SPK4_GIAMU|nr:hypothetical protein GMRT_23779 [Giardia muris]|eukprot:TNJ26795.1 hypothetical protein GMRT_23779 [Giardia muris]
MADRGSPSEWSWLPRLPADEERRQTCVPPGLSERMVRRSLTGRGADRCSWFGPALQDVPVRPGCSWTPQENGIITQLPGLSPPAARGGADRTDCYHQRAMDESPPPPPSDIPERVFPSPFSEEDDRRAPSTSASPSKESPAPGRLKASPATSLTGTSPTEPRSGDPVCWLPPRAGRQAGGVIDPQGKPPGLPEDSSPEDWTPITLPSPSGGIGLRVLLPSYSHVFRPSWWSTIPRTWGVESVQSGTPRTSLMLKTGGV